MSRVEQIGDCRLILGDCREILPTLGKVDAVVTSPPYAQQHDYGSKIADWPRLMGAAFGGVQTHETTQILVNLGLIHKDGEVWQYWDTFVSSMRETGWRLFGWYVWDKCDGMGGDWHGRLAPAHEFVFHFNKSAREIRKVYQSKLAGLTHKGNPGLRGPDGVAKGYAHQGRKVQEFKIADSVLRITPERTNYEATEHPAVYPVLLPQVLADTFTDPGETVSDPFMGSGTTGVACVKLGRKFIGIEIEPKYFDIAVRRIEAATKESRLPLPEPKPVQLSLVEGDR